MVPIQIGYFLLLINHIFFPEAVLFTHEQIGIAMKAYDKVAKSSQESPDRGITRIKEYLDSLPEDLKTQLTGS